MIIDLEKFITAERPRWRELEGVLDTLEKDAAHRLSLREVKQFHYLYQRASADLAKVRTFASEPRLCLYLETLVARAYAEVHETRKRPHRFAFIPWFFKTFPQTFRRRQSAFWFATAVTLLGCLFGAFAISLDPEAKSALIGFYHL